MKARPTVGFEFYPDDPEPQVREYTNALLIHVELGDWEGAARDVIRIQQLIRFLLERAGKS